MDRDSITITVPELDDKHLRDLLKSNPATQLKTEDVLCIMESPSPSYARTAFFLSETNRIIFWETYRKTFLFENYDNFDEEEMYYLCEAVKNQILQGFDDFYLVMHHFFRKLKHSLPLQGLFVFLLESFSFELRELILTHGVLEGIIEDDSVSPVFKLKVIKKVLQANHPVLNEYLTCKKFRVSIKDPTGCIEYFRKWYRDSFLIEVRFL